MAARQYYSYYSHTHQTAADSGSDVYTLAVEDSVARTRQLGLSYAMVDEDGLPFEPVKLKTFSLCCH